MRLARTEPTSTASSDEDELPEVPLDKQATLGLVKKDLTRTSRQQVLEDLSSRQVAACISGILPFVLPSDLCDLGGEYETRQLKCKRSRSCV